MSAAYPLTERLKHWLASICCAAVLGYFLFHGLMGERGLFALNHMQYKLAAAKAELQKTKDARMVLEARTRLLRPDHLDLDMLDERARAQLGYTKPNEYVILLDSKRQ